MPVLLPFEDPEELKEAAAVPLYKLLLLVLPLLPALSVPPGELLPVLLLLLPTVLLAVVPEALGQMVTRIGSCTAHYQCQSAR